MYYNIVYFLELAAALTALICLCFLRTRFLLACTALQLLTIAVENMGKYLTYEPHKYLLAKLIMYNVFNGLEFALYVWVIYELLEDRTEKLRYLVLGAIMLVFSAVNFIYIQGYLVYNNLTTTVCSILLIVLCLYKLLQSTERGHFNRSHRTAIVIFLTVVFLYYTTIFGHNTMINTLLRTDPEKASFLYGVINRTANTVLYSGIIVSLVVYTRAYY